MNCFPSKYTLKEKYFKDTNSVAFQIKNILSCLCFHKHHNTCGNEIHNTSNKNLSMVYYVSVFGAFLGLILNDLSQPGLWLYPATCGTLGHLDLN